MLKTMKSLHPMILCSTLLLPACSTTDLISVASSRDPSTALSNLAKNRGESYKHNPVRLVSDIRQLQRNYNQLQALLRGEVGREWGNREVVTPSNKRYVKYTQNYKSRAIVEFDRGLVMVETLDQQQPDKSLKNAIVTTLLTPDDPRGVDLYTASTIKLSGRPYLYGLLLDHRGRGIDTPSLAEAYADHLLAQKRQQRQVDTATGSKTVHYVRLQMVNDYQNRQARRYHVQVEKYAKKYGVSKSLIYAIMKTESAFNPFAVSAAPAYGLMQLVPTTAGRDAFRVVEGYDHTPSKEYLFIADNNIELGTAYLSILDRRYLASIHDPLSREYCIISAYNGGAGNVFNLFANDRTEAARRINRLSPAEVYRNLRDKHPRDETRRYLVKVLDARKDFVSI